MEEAYASVVNEKWETTYVKGICDQKSIEKLSELKLISDDVVTQ